MFRWCRTARCRCTTERTQTSRGRSTNRPCSTEGGRRSHVRGEYIPGSKASYTDRRYSGQATTAATESTTLHQPERRCRGKLVPSFFLKNECTCLFKKYFFPRTCALVEFYFKQECIPVGCVPSAAVAMSIPACTGHCVSQHAVGRGCLPGGVCLGVSALRQTPPFVDRMTDRCKNITFANYVCGR